ncbi:hypothetical protein ACO0KV_07375, partial [Undibacterium sp. RuRC25W]
GEMCVVHYAISTGRSKRHKCYRILPSLTGTVHKLHFILEFAFHKCDNRKCFNPNHLFTGKQAANMQDMKAKGRGRKNFDSQLGDKHWSHINPEKIPTGSKHHASKLSDGIVEEIRLSKETSTALAKKFNVSVATICYARKGKTWKHVSL